MATTKQRVYLSRMKRSGSLEKTSLRQRILQMRKAISIAHRKEANETIRKHILDQWDPTWGTILIYINQPDEVETIPLINHLLQGKAKVCVPAFDHKLNSYYPSELKDFKNDLEFGQFGILEPKAKARRPIPLEKLDAVIVPGLAFDLQGNRLGYGRGFFDKICHALRATKIGLAYSFQLIENLIPHPNDVPMDLVITEKKILRCPNR